MNCIFSTTLSDANEEPVTADSATEDSPGIAPTDSGYIKEDDDGNYKGKVAAIALSCVGAVCLIVLAGLLVGNLPVHKAPSKIHVLHYFSM